MADVNLDGGMKVVLGVLSVRGVGGMMVGAGVEVVSVDGGSVSDGMVVSGLAGRELDHLLSGAFGLKMPCVVGCEEGCGGAEPSDLMGGAVMGGLVKCVGFK